MRQFALLSGGKCQTSSWFTAKETFYDTLCLLRIRQTKATNSANSGRDSTLMTVGAAALTIKAGCSGEWDTGASGVNNSASLDVEAISAQNQHHSAQVQSLGASAAASRRSGGACVATSDLGDSEGGPRGGKQVHYTSTLAHITPQRAVNEDSGEMSWPRPPLGKLLDGASGVNVSFVILTPDLWPQTFPRSRLSFQTACVEPCAPLRVL